MFQGASDYPHFVRIINAASRGEGGDRVETLEGMTAAYGHLERCDPAHDLLVVEENGAPVGYSRVYWDQHLDGPCTYGNVCFVDPAVQRRGIGIAPGANINYQTGHGIFEATHGTAPKYAGQDKVNPSSVILSGVMCAMIASANSEHLSSLAPFIRRWKS